MFGLTVGKLIALALVLYAAWRGLKILQRMQEPQKVKREPGGPKTAEPAATAVELTACPHCELYIPKGRPCPGPQRCIHRAAG